MTIQTTLEMRKHELSRRVGGLPLEVKDWKARTQAEVDNNLHFSQLNAIGVFMNAFCDQQAQLLAQMDPAGDLAAFQANMLELIKNIIRSQKAWDFFRDKLDLRFSPDFKDILWVADTVAWDCYRPVLEGAAAQGILNTDELREAPLTYLIADFSPYTWSRGSRPNDGRNYDLGTTTLPIPVIALPWDLVQNIWEIMALHHEVGHDLEADLNLRAPLSAALQAKLTQAGVPKARIQQWLAWQGELFADLVGLQLGGPAFAEALLNMFLLPSAMVTTPDPSDPHPTYYPRILMNAAYIPTLIPGNQALVDHGQQIAGRWTAVYGPQPQFQPVMQDFPLVYQALMDQPLLGLKGKCVRDLLPYTAVDDLKITNAAGYIETGMNKPKALRPRHCISAARLAVTQAALDGTLTDALMDQINQRTAALVRENAEDGLHGGSDSSAHKKFIASFVNLIQL